MNLIIYTRRYPDTNKCPPFLVLEQLYSGQNLCTPTQNLQDRHIAGLKCIPNIYRTQCNLSVIDVFGLLSACREAKKKLGLLLYFSGRFSEALEALQEEKSGEELGVEGDSKMAILIQKLKLLRSISGAHTY